MTDTLKDILNQRFESKGFTVNEGLSTKELAVLNGDVADLAGRKGLWLYVPTDGKKQHCRYVARTTILHGVVPIDDIDGFKTAGRHHDFPSATVVKSVEGENYFVLPGDEYFDRKLVDLLESAGLIEGIDYKDISDREGDFSTQPFFRWASGEASSNSTANKMGSKGALDLRVISLKETEGELTATNPGRVGEMNAETKEITEYDDQHLGLRLSYTFNGFEGLERNETFSLLAIVSHLRSYLTSNPETIKFYSAERDMFGHYAKVDLPVAALFYDKDWVLENLSDAFASVMEHEEFSKTREFFKEMKSADWFPNTSSFSTPLVYSVIAAHGDIDRANALSPTENEELSRVNKWKQRIIAEDYVPLMAGLAEKVDPRLMTYFEKLC
jgi:hypothetical protein